MTEPVVSPVAAGVGASAITLTGSILGMQYDALTVAFIGGIAALMHLPPMPTRVEKFMSVAISSIVGGLFSPLAVAAAPIAGDWVTKVDEMALRLGCAFLLGLFAQVAIPVGMSILRRKGEAA